MISRSPDHLRPRCLQPRSLARAAVDRHFVLALQDRGTSFFDSALRGCLSLPRQRDSASAVVGVGSFGLGDGLVAGGILIDRHAGCGRATRTGLKVGSQAKNRSSDAVFGQVQMRMRERRPSGCGVSSTAVRR